MATSSHPFVIEPLESRIAPATFSVMALDPSAPELDSSNASTLRFQVTLSNAETTAQTVHFATIAESNGVPATAGSDFDAVSQMLTFAPNGPLTQIISVKVRGDLAFEANETVNVQLSNPGAGSTVTQANASAQIIDDERLTISNVTVTEGNSGFNTAVFTIGLKGTLASNQRVSFEADTADGTAVSTGTTLRDFVAVVDQPGEIRGSGRFTTVAVQIQGDSVEELSEAFQLRLSNARLETIIPASTTTDNPPVVTPESFVLIRAVADASGTATILADNDAAPTVSITDARVVEGNTGPVQAQFTVNLSAPLGFDVTVRYSTGPDPRTGAISATGGTDFASATSASVVIAAGQTSVAVRVAVTGDELNEADETFAVNILSADYQKGTGAATSLTSTDSLGIGTIANDDNQILSITPVALTAVVEGATSASFRIALVKDAVGPVVIRYSTADGTATAGSDYTATTGTFTIAPGQKEGFVTVALLNDNVDELDQSFSLNITGVDGASAAGVSSGSLVLTDDDATPTITVAPASVSEGGALVFTVQLSRASDRAITVPYRVVAAGENPASSADYTAPTQTTLTIPAGALSGTITVQTTPDDFDEPNETIRLELARNPDGTVAPIINADINGTELNEIGTITDNDFAPTVSIATPAGILEGAGGTQTLVFTVSLSAASGLPVTVKFNTIDGTATVADSDFVAQTGTLTFAPGTQTQTIGIVVNGDPTFENDENFSVRLTEPANATLGTATAAGTIRGDEVGFRLIPINTAVSEGNDNVTVSTVRFKIERIGGAEFSTSVGYRTVDKNVDSALTAVSSGPRADFTALNGRATFAPGVGTVNSDEFSVVIRGDRNFEVDETFRIELFDAAGGVISSTVNAGAFTATINNDDERPRIKLAPLTTQKENAGDFNFSVVLVDAAGLPVVNETGAPITVDVSTAEQLTALALDRAKAGADYDPRVFLSTDLNTSVTSITFAPGDQQKTVVVKVTNDLIYEADQRFLLKLSGAPNVFFGTPATSVDAVAVLANDDAAPLVSITGPSATTPNVTVAEGELAIASLRLQRVTTAGTLVDAESEVPVSVRVSTVAGSPGVGVATAGQDFTSLSAELVTFDINPTTGRVVPVKTFAVQTLDDTRIEAVETFDLRIDSVVPRTPTNSTEPVLDARINDGRTVVSISDNEFLPALTINDVNETESNDGSKTAPFTVTLSAPSDRPVTVTFTTVNGADLIGASSSGAFADFVARNGTLTFAPGEVTKTIDVALLGDIYQEADETFQVVLSAANGAEIARATGTATILNGVDSVFGIAVSDTFAAEDASAIFQVETSMASTTPVTFTATPVQGTAKAAADFIAFPVSASIAANARNGTFTVGVINDGVFERAELFNVELSAAAGAPSGSTIAFTTPRATGVISDNDIFFASNGRTVQWTDVDGDLVTLRVSKGSLAVGQELTFGLVGTLGGRQLQDINLVNTGNEFFRANISVTAEKQVGLNGNGLVNVGQIRANPNPANVLAATSGVDLGTVTIDGDLRAIRTGDEFTDTALAGLNVGSLGVRTDTGFLPIETTPPGTPDPKKEFRNDSRDIGIVSSLLGPVGSIKVAGDLAGTFVALGGTIGNIGSLTVGGALRGGAADGSGSVQFTGVLSRASIGSIIGGSGGSSGSISGQDEDGDGVADGRIGTVTVRGDIIGGSGFGSGAILADSISSVTANQLVGGSGGSSGSIFSGGRIGAVTLKSDLVGGTIAADNASRSLLTTGSGSIIALGTVGPVKIGGNVIGGGSDYSGAIVGLGGVTSVAITGNLQGGDGLRSGSIRAGGFVNFAAELDNLEGRVGSQAFAGNIGKVTIGKVGTDSIVGGGGFGAGSILAQFGNIGSVMTAGSVRGGSGDQTGGIQTQNLLVVRDAFGQLSFQPTARGNITTVSIGGGLLGGDGLVNDADGEGGRALARSGFIEGFNVGTVTIAGNVEAGENLGFGLSGSGVIGAENTLGTVTIKKDVLGSTTNAVIISGGGRTNDLAIAKVQVLGNVNAASILAGSSSADLFSGASSVKTYTADAQIGRVLVTGSVSQFNIAASISVGADGRLGTADDSAARKDIPTSLTRDSVKLFSKIAEVQVKGFIAVETQPFAFVAQNIVKVSSKVGVIPLTTGAGNDLYDEAGTAFFRVFEVPVGVPAAQT